MAGIDRRRALRLAGAAGVAGLAASATGLVAACAGPRSETPLAQRRPVRVGLLLPAAGSYRGIGDEIQNGFRSFLNAHGGLLGGHPAQEVVEDEGDSPAEAAEALERLLELDVHAVVGVTDSEAILELGTLAEQARVPLLSAHASPQQLTGVPYVWRTSYVHQEPGLALGRYLVSEVSGEVAVIAQDDLLGTDAVAGLSEAFAEAQAEDQLAEPVFTADQEEPDPELFAEPLALVAATDPAAVFCAYAGESAIEFLEQYLAAGLDPTRLYAPAHLTEPPALAELGGEIAGVRTCANYAPELRGAANRAFAVDYRAAYGPPSVYAVAGRDAAAVLDVAIRLTGEALDPRQINLALGEVGLVDSPRGRWQFNQNRTPTQKWYLREAAPDGPVMANMVIQELGTLG